MKVLNIHTRIIDQPKSKLLKLFQTLATDDDKIWPAEQWPPMRFKSGLHAGAEGGHGPIRYKVVRFDPAGLAEFEFIKPSGFTGIHRFEITKLNENQSEIKHTIDMSTRLLATITWVFAIRWLHDALIEDAFDKVKNQLTDSAKRTEWNFWVKFLRRRIKRKH